MNPPDIHPQAICSSDEIGDGVSIGAFSNIAEGVCLADGVTVGNRVMIGREASVGERTTIDDGAILSPGMEIGTGCHIGPGAIFAFRRLEGETKGTRETRTVVGTQCVIGANVTVCAGVVGGDFAVLDAGAVLTRNAPPYTVMAGNPAKVVGFSGTGSEGGDIPAERSAGEVQISRVRGVKTCSLPFFSDPRGNLAVGEFGSIPPFQPRRFFSHLRCARRQSPRRACPQKVLTVSRVRPGILCRRGR